MEKECVGCPSASSASRDGSDSWFRVWGYFHAPRAGLGCGVTFADKVGPRAGVGLGVQGSGFGLQGSGCRVCRSIGRIPRRTWRHHRLKGSQGCVPPAPVSAGVGFESQGGGFKDSWFMVQGERFILKLGRASLRTSREGEGWCGVWGLGSRFWGLRVDSPG